MRPHRTYALTRSSTPIYINDTLSDLPTGRPTRQAARFPAVLGLALGVGLAVLVMLGTWLTLSTWTTAGVTTFVAHAEGQAPAVDDPETIPPALYADMLKF
jgi:hypothetical protein